MAAEVRVALQMAAPEAARVLLQAEAEVVRREVEMGVKLYRLAGRMM